MTLALRVVSHSEIGLVRKNNQDSGYASPRLLVVADGMGGAAAGDLASAVAVDTLRRVDEDVSGEAMLPTMAAAVAAANQRIAALVDEDTALDGMGTTVTAMLFDGSELGLVHIGDSRAYRWRDAVLERLTHDHSWVQSLVDEGKISEDEAAVHPHRSLLLRVLNGQSGSEPELSLVQVRAGDRLLLCSDGLCGLVDDGDIAQLLSRPDRAEALEALVQAARAAGGVDNITVIVADVVPVGLEPGVAPVEPAATPTQSASPVILGAAAELAIPATAEQTIQIERQTDGATTDRPGAAPGPTGGTEDEARYRPQPPRRRRFVRPLIGLLVVLLVAGAGLGAGYAWTRTQYYVGVAGDQVAIYQGVAERLPGLPLSTVYEVQPLPVAGLPVYYQTRVRASIGVSSLTAARETVTELRDAARRCATTTPPTVSPPKPAPPTGPSTVPTGIADPRAGC